MSNDVNSQAMFILTFYILIISTVVACENHTVTNIPYEHWNHNFILNVPYINQVSTDNRNYNNLIPISNLCKVVHWNNFYHSNLVINKEYRNWVKESTQYQRNNNCLNHATDIEITSFVFLPTKRRLLSEDYYDDSELDLEIEEQFINDNQPVNNPYKKTINSVLETEKDNDDEKEEYEDKNEDVAKVKSSNDDEEDDEDEDEDYDDEETVTTEFSNDNDDDDGEESVDLSYAENSTALFVLVCSLLLFTRVIHLCFLYVM